MGELKDYNFWLNFFIGRIKNLSSYKQHLFNFIKTTVRYVIKTASGAIASFPDGADDVPMLSIKAQIDPVQDLHGYDSPWPAGGGKNKLEVTSTSATQNGVTITVNSDGTISLSGTATDQVIFGVGSVALSGEYILSGCPSGGSYSTYFLYCRSYDYGSGATVTFDGTSKGVQIYVRSGVNTNGLVFKPMIRLASELDATFAPYSNECPISGHTGVTVEKRGKNLLDISQANEVRKNGGTLFTLDYLGDNTVRMNASSVGAFYVIWEIIKVAPHMIGESITISNDGNANIYIYKTGKDGSWASPPTSLPSNVRTATFTEDDVGRVFGYGFYNDSGTTKTLTNAQVELGSTATDYETFEGKIISQEFVDAQGNQLTVYGGESEIVGGKLTVDRAMVTLDGSEAWQWQGVNRAYLQLNSMERCIDYRAKMICDKLATKQYHNVLLTETGISGYVKDSSYPNQNWVYINVGASSLAETKAWLADNPITVVYPLATPQTIQLTPQEVRTFLGQNNIWNDTGNTEVTYLSKEE